MYISIMEKGSGVSIEGHGLGDDRPWCGTYSVCDTVSLVMIDQNGVLSSVYEIVVYMHEAEKRFALLCKQIDST